MSYPVLVEVSQSLGDVEQLNYVYFRRVERYDSEGSAPIC